MRRFAIALALFVYAPLAYAGGFETPDNGAEALGRGGAFTAKASDLTAIQYNVAGLAGQRGTRILFDGKISFDQYQFTRFGTYPGPLDPALPWQDQFYGTVSNQGAPLFAPFFGVSTDFGRFDRLTVAAGVFAPSGVGNPTYPLGVSSPDNTGGWPSPSRYDVVQANSVIALPTLAAAYRLTDWLDVGAAFHFVYGSFDLTNVTWADLGCTDPVKNNPNPGATIPEFQPCDTVNHLVTTGTAMTGSGGFMLHPEKWWSIGFNARAPIHIDSTGTITSQPPAVAPAQGVNTGSVTFTTELPWQIRAGTRAIVWDGDFEQADVEVDAVYETWSRSQGLGSFVKVPHIGPFDDVNTVILHKYSDVLSVRLGGAYNVKLAPSMALSLRAGAYYETPATQPADTRLDFNTLAKIAGTVGAGFTWHGVGVNLAYAMIRSPERIVSNGELRPIDPAEHGDPVDHNQNLLPAVNNGRYDGMIQMLSFGVRVEIETMLGTNRSKRFDPQGELALDTTPPPAPESVPAPVPAPESEPPKPAEVAPPKSKPPASPPPRKTSPSKKNDDDEKTRRLEDPFAT